MMIISIFRIILLDHNSYMVRQIVRNLILDTKKNFQFFQISFFFSFCEPNSRGFGHFKFNLALIARRSSWRSHPTAARNLLQQRTRIISYLSWRTLGHVRISVSTRGLVNLLVRSCPRWRRSSREPWNQCLPGQNVWKRKKKKRKTNKGTETKSSNFSFR